MSGITSSDVAFRGKAPLISDIVSKRNESISPIDGWNSSVGKIFFILPQSSEEWVSSVFNLLIRFTITKADDTNLDGTNSVAFLSCPISSLFQDAELSVGATVVEGLNQSLSWTGFLKASLGLSPAAAGSWARDSYLAIADTPGQSQSQAPANNSGFAQRQLLTADSAMVTALGPIPFDVSQAALSFPAGTPLKIVLTHRPDSERLVSSDAGAAYKLKIGGINLIATYLRLSEPALLGLRHKLSANSLTFPFLRTGMIGPSVVAVGTREHSWTLTRGTCPDLVLFAFAPVTYTDSSYNRNFMCFENCGVAFLQCMVSGLLFPSTPLTPDFESGVDTLPIYLSVIECAKLFNDGDISLTYDRWMNGLCIFPVLFRPHMPSLSYSSPAIEGELVVKIKFRAATTQALNAFAFTIIPSRIAVTQQRTVQLLDFVGG